jgi:hypothetical protein
MVWACEKRNACRVLERKYLQDKDHLQYLGVDVMTILILILKGKHGRTWTRFMWRRNGASVGLMWMWQWIMGFQESQGISWPAKDLSASQGRLCTVQFSQCLCRIQVAHVGSYSFLPYLLRSERKTVPCLTTLSCAKFIHSWKYIQEWL